MKNWFVKGQLILKKEPTVLFFLVVVLASFIWHTNFRNQHFQECDSAGVYHLLYGFPKEALLYTAFTYPNGHLISSGNAEKIASLSFVQVVMHKYLPNYNHAQLIHSLTQVNLFALLRFAYIEIVNFLHLPFQALGFFSLPFSSTYSPGHGLFYGLVNSARGSYEQFMSHSLVVTLLVFHLAVLFLFFSLRNLKFNVYAAAGASLMMLFSFSLYSSGYNLGSTVWNFASVSLWLWALTYFWDRERGLKNISIFSGILIFFNYLLVFFWLALVVAILPKNRDMSWQKVKVALKTQIFAAVCILLCTVLFYQPGQGNRGLVGLKTFFSDIYYIVLNFFAFYTHSQSLNYIQFGFGVLCLLALFYFIFQRPRQEAPTRTFLREWLKIFFVIFAITILIGLLGFAPNRQLLFLSPLVFLGAGFFLDSIFSRLNFRHSSTLLFFVILAAVFVGFRALRFEKADANDLTTAVTLPSDINSAVVRDCSFNFVDKDWHSAVPVVFADATQFQSGQKYLYLSQSVPFEQAVAEWQKDYNIELKVLSQLTEITNVYFMAFNPDFKRFPYSRPNNLFETKFEIINISKK